MQQIHFNLDYLLTSNMQFGANGETLSYTDNGIQANVDGTSICTLEVDGLRMGTGQYSDSGARFKYEGNIPFNHAFLVIKENKNHLGANYDKVVLATHGGEINSIYNWTDGISISTNNSLTLQSVFRKTNAFVRHWLNVKNLVQRASQPTLSFAIAGEFKVIKLFLPQNNTGSKLLIGGLDGSINTTSYSQFTIKRLVLASGTQAEGDIYFSNLKTEYGL